MKNKLPVVGRRYRHKQYAGQEVEIIATTENRIVYEVVNCLGLSKGQINSYCKSVVWNFLEELPEDNSQKIEQLKVKESVLSEEVRKAIANLKYAMNVNENLLERQRIDIVDLSKNLINALEAVDKPNIPEKISCGYEMPENHGKEYKGLDLAQDKADATAYSFWSAKKQQPKSIWKDINEFTMNDLNHYILRRKTGEVTILTDFNEIYFLLKDTAKKEKLSSFASITDLINAFEQMQKDIKELKNNNNKK